MDLKKLVLDYLTSCKAMQLATVSNGQPWLCTVYFAIDDQLNIYWTSAKSRQHSKEIIDHPQVAVTVVKDIERKQALQITGIATMVDLKDAERVNKIYGAKFGDKPERLAEVLADDHDRAYWTVKPTSIFLWDEVNFPTQPKQEFKLPLN